MCWQRAHLYEANMNSEVWQAACSLWAYLTYEAVVYRLGHRCTGHTQSQCVLITCFKFSAVGHIVRLVQCIQTCSWCAQHIPRDSWSDSQSELPYLLSFKWRRTLHTLQAFLWFLAHRTNRACHWTITLSCFSVISHMVGRGVQICGHIVAAANVYMLHAAGWSPHVFAASREIIFNC